MITQLSESLYLQYRDDLYRLARKRIGHPDTAEDIVQSVFLRFAEYNGHAYNIRAFLYRSLNNAVVDWFRTTGERPSEPEHIDDLTQSGNEVPINHACQAERIQAVTVALARLSPADQAAIRARYYDDLSSEECAERLGISCDAARQRLSRAIEHLRGLLTYTNKESILQVCTTKNHTKPGTSMSAANHTV
jgi:RNA polymerase sigma-70 factor (ECF subfamily)